MNTLIAEYIDKAISLIAAALFLKYYFSPKMPRFYKKKWVVVASCILIIYAMIGVRDAYLEYVDQRIPSKEEIQEKIIANNIFVEEEFAFNSPDGFSVIIPAGYAYTVLPSGAISMTAIKEQAQSAIVVAVLNGNDPIEKTLDETIKLLKNKNNTYTFKPATEIKVGSNKAIRVDLEVEKQGMQVQGIFIFSKPGNRLYQFMMSCPSSIYSQESPVYEKIINSIKLI